MTAHVLLGLAVTGYLAATGALFVAGRRAGYDAGYDDGWDDRQAELLGLGWTPADDPGPYQAPPGYELADAWLVPAPVNVPGPEGANRPVRRAATGDSGPGTPDDDTEAWLASIRWRPPVHQETLFGPPTLTLPAARTHWVHTGCGGPVVWDLRGGHCTECKAGPLGVDEYEKNPAAEGETVP